MKNITTEQLDKLQKLLNNKNFTKDIDDVKKFVIDTEDLPRLDLIDYFHFESDGKGEFIKNSIRIIISKENIEKLCKESSTKGKFFKTLKKLKSITSSSITLALINGKFLIID